MLFFHLFDRMNFPAQVGELGKLLLNGLQPLVSLAVRDLGFRIVPALQPVLLVQLLNLGNLNPETSDLFPKNP